MTSHTVNQDIVFKLDQNLVYKLNRNLDINDQKSNVLVSFVVELEGNLPREYHNRNSQLGEARLDVELGQSNFEMYQHVPFVENSNWENITLVIPWEKIENTPNMLFGGTLGLTAFYKIGEKVITEKKEEIFDVATSQLLSEQISIINTEMNLFDSVGDYQITSDRRTIITGKSTNNQVGLTLKSVKMKVMTDLTFNQVSSKGGDINTVQSFTYLLYDKDKNIDLIESHGRWLSKEETENFARNVNFPDLILLGNETIHTGSPHVSFQEGNTLYVRANKIHVQGHLLIQSGFRVVLYATEEVKLLQGARINADTKIQIGDRFVRFPWKKKIYEATSDEVYSFCNQNNNEYKANQSNARLVPNDGEQNQEDTLVEEEIAQHINNQPNPSVLYPNPNNGVFTIGFERQLEENAELTIMDMSGRKVASQTLANGQNTFALDYSSLSSGIYMVQIVYKQNKTTHKLVLREVH
jgi:hypothetical protein